MRMFQKPAKTRKISGEEAANALIDAHGLKTELRHDLILNPDGQLPAAAEALVDAKIAAMEDRLKDFMVLQLAQVARYTRGNQSMAEVAGMEASGENTLIDGHLSVPGEAEFEGDVFLAGQAALSQPKLTKTEYKELMNSAARPASRLLGRRPNDEFED